ncbi:MAG: hypothetical protein IKO07_10355 [Clostridia bacterium]|nr:hypothetical protein [Clostridia bacterium]
MFLTALAAFFEYVNNIGLERDLRPDGSICASLIAVSVILNGVAFLGKEK